MSCMLNESPQSGVVCCNTNAGNKIVIKYNQHQNSLAHSAILNERKCKQTIRANSSIFNQTMYSHRMAHMHGNTLRCSDSTNTM